MIYMTQPYSLVVTFGGTASITDANNAANQQKIITVAGPGARMAVTGVKVIGCQEATGATGTSTFAASNAAWDGTGDVISSSVGTGAGSGTKASGSFEVLVGGSLYVFCTAAGGHSGAQVQIDLEPA